MSTMNCSKVIDEQSFYDVIAPTLENGPKPVLETSFSKKIFSVILVCVGQCRFTPKTSLKSLEKPEIFVEISRQCNSFIQTWEKPYNIILKVLMQTMGAQTKKSLYENPLSVNFIIVSRAKKWSERTKTMYISVKHTHTRHNGISISDTICFKVIFVLVLPVFLFRFM